MNKDLVLDVVVRGMPLTIDLTVSDVEQILEDEMFQDAVKDNRIHLVRDAPLLEG